MSNRPMAQDHESRYEQSETGAKRRLTLAQRATLIYGAVVLAFAVLVLVFT